MMRTTSQNKTSALGTIARIQMLLPQLKGKLRVIADYILKHEEVIDLTIVQFIRITGASFGTVDRFCKRVGYSGFQDLKINLAGDLAARKAVADGSAQPGTLAALAETAMQDIRQTLELLDDRKLSRAARAICRGRQVMVAGLSSSAGIAQTLEYRLTRLGLNATAVTDNHMQLHRAAILSRGDVAFLISFSGSTREILSTAGIAKNSGATVICLTNYADSPLAELADVSLTTAISNDPLGAEIASKVAVEFLIHALVQAIMRQAPKALANLRKTFTATADRQL